MVFQSSLTSTSLQCSSDHGDDDYGNALPELGKLTSLTYLNLADSKFRGSLWDLRRLSRLASLDLSRNGWLMDLKDTLPVIANLTGLTALNLAHHFIELDAFAPLSQLRALERLDLSGNELGTREYPSWPSALTRLTHLDLPTTAAATGAWARAQPG